MDDVDSPLIGAHNYCTQACGHDHCPCVHNPFPCACVYTYYVILLNSVTYIRHVHCSLEYYMHVYRGNPLVRMPNGHPSEVQIG